MKSKLQSLRVQLLGVCGVLGLVALAFALTPEAGRASSYTVHECTAQQGTVDDATLEGSATGYNPSNACGFAGGRLEMRSAGAVSPGLNRQWAFGAPDGTRMSAATGHFELQGADEPDCNDTYLFIRTLGGPEQIVADVSRGGSTSGDYDSSQQNGPIDKIGIGLTCTHSGAQGNCSGRPGMFSRVSDLDFQMQDTVAPEVPQTSGSALGGWVNGTRTVDFDVSDTGAGVSLTGTSVNGTIVDFDGLCFPDTDPTGAVKRLRPCPAGGRGSTSFDVAAGPFVQGDNALLVCVNEYGANPQGTCRRDTVRVDTIAPTAPGSLVVAGGEGWRRDNDFDLRWQNPAQVHAPIVGAEVRITGPGGYDRTTFHPGADRSSIDDVRVPVVGDYTATVYLRDAAGNEAPANASTIHLRFDDAVPGRSNPVRADGWISRRELTDGYAQRWEPPAIGETPSSGIAGYRVAVNTNSDTDPCSGAADQRACGGPITEVGPAALTRVLGPGSLAEGTNYVHVVAVSGAGMRATQVGRTALRVDLTDPVTLLQGDGGGEWLNHDANLQAVASDALSGMQDTDEFAADAAPRTTLSVDGRLSRDADANVSATVVAEGVHQVSFWSRDLAGNENDGLGPNRPPATATVRIDKTEPLVAFTNSQDPDDPDKLLAPVSDALSGVVEGRISYRQIGGDEWKILDTALRDGVLVSRVDSGDLRPEVSYEFRAVAADRAGNRATSTSRQNGSPMVVTGPFRATTAVVDLELNGRTRAKIGYGRGARVSGSLLTAEGGRPIGASVRVTETFASGARLRPRSTTLKTDEDGGFVTTLDEGPSRTVVVSYRGDRLYLGTSSPAAKLGVRSRVSLKVAPTARASGSATFRGRIEASGARIGRAGKRLEIQVRIGRSWRTVGKSLRTNRRGAFALTYRFTGSYDDPITYEFRAVVLRERGFPYLRSVSRRRSVTVSP